MSMMKMFFVAFAVAVVVVVVDDADVETFQEHNETLLGY